MVSGGFRPNTGEECGEEEMEERVGEWEGTPDGGNVDPDVFFVGNFLKLVAFLLIVDRGLKNVSTYVKRNHDTVVSQIIHECATRQ